jgi:pyruvate kinase
LRFNFPHYNKKRAARDIKNIREVEKEVEGKFDLLLDTE